MRIKRVLVFDSLKNYILVDKQDNILVGNSITTTMFGELCSALAKLE